MTLLIERIAEQRIQEAVEDGVFERLSGQGKPLMLDEDRDVPKELRMGYHILKNAGYLPPELQQRKEAISLCDLVAQSDIHSEELKQARKMLNKLEQRMQLQGLKTEFIHEYLLKRCVIEKYHLGNDDQA